MASDAPSTGITRRTLVKTTAWTVPVVALAMAAPGASASTANGALGFLYFDAQNTWGNLIRGGGVIEINGSSSNTPVTSIVLTLTFDPAATIDSWEDTTGEAGSAGWVLTTPYTNGVVTFTYAGVALTPYAKTPYLGFGFNVTSASLPTTVSVIASSGQADGAAGSYPVRAAG